LVINIAGDSSLGSTSEAQAWTSGYESALSEALRIVDAMRAPGATNLATPIILRIRAELIALQEGRELSGKAA
jgi:hypothetical protein